MLCTIDLCCAPPACVFCTMVQKGDLIFVRNRGHPQHLPFFGGSHMEHKEYSHSVVCCFSFSIKIFHYIGRYPHFKESTDHGIVPNLLSLGVKPVEQAAHIFEPTCAYARWAHMHRFPSVCLVVT